MADQILIPEVFTLTIGETQYVLTRDGALAISRECCCCIAQGTVHQVDGFIDQANWTGAAPTPSLGKPECTRGFLMGVLVADCRNLNSGYVIVWYIVECGEETPGFDSKFSQSLKDDHNVEDAEGFIHSGFADVKDDSYFDYLFPAPTEFDPDRFAQCQQEWTQERNSYKACCQAPDPISGCLEPEPYTGDAPIGPI